MANVLTPYTPQNLNLDLGPMAATSKLYSNMTGGPGDIPQLMKAYQQTHAAELGMNSELAQNILRLGGQLQTDATRGGQAIIDAYGNVVQGGEALRADAANQNANIFGQYGDLSNQVLGDISGIEQSRLNDINQQYAQDLSSAGRSLAARGMGDSSTMISLQRGLQSDRDRARTNLANEIAGLRAGYRSNLGLAGLTDLRRGQEQGINLGRENLGYKTQVAREQGRQGDIQTGLGQDTLQFIKSMNVPYTPVQGFLNLAQQYGSTNQAGQDRAAVMNAIAAMNKAATPSKAMTAMVPTSNGGFMGGTGRGLSPSENNFGPMVSYGGAPSLGLGSIPMDIGGGGGETPVFSPSLQGSGGGFAGNAYLPPGSPMTNAGAYTGYGGQTVAGSGFGGGFSSTGSTAAGMSGGGGGYTPYGGFDGGGTWNDMLDEFWNT